MIAGLLMIAAISLVVGLALGLVASLLFRRRVALIVAGLSGLAGLVAVLLTGQGDFRQSMHAAGLAFSVLPLALGLLLGAAVAPARWRRR